MGCGLAGPVYAWCGSFGSGVANVEATPKRAHVGIQGPSQHDF
jgi:hypothetical protein